MPDANGRFRGMSVNAEAWERIFGPKVKDYAPARQAREMFREDAPVSEYAAGLIDYLFKP